MIGSAVQQSDGVRVMTPRKAPPRMAAPVSHAHTMQKAINKVRSERLFGGEKKITKEINLQYFIMDCNYRL